MKTAYALTTTLSLLFAGGNARAEESALPLAISGYVDASVSGAAATDSLGDMAFGAAFDKLKLELEKKWEKVGLRADLAFAPDRTVTDTLEQGYVQVEAYGQTFRLGRFYAPIGFELIDARDMYQFSHAAVFDFGIPSFLTGLAIEGALGQIGYIVYVANGSDVLLDNNAAKTVGGRVHYAFSDDRQVGLSALFGAEQDRAYAGKKLLPRLTLDIDAAWKLSDAAVLGTEITYGQEKFSGLSPTDGTATVAVNSWYGGLLMLHYDYAAWGGVTARIDYFADSSKVVGDPSFTRMGMGSDATQLAFTLAPTFAFAEGAGAIVEFKYQTFAGNDADTAGGETPVSGDALLIAIEGTFAF